MGKLIKNVAENVYNVIPKPSKPFVDIKRIKCIGGKGGDGALAFSKHGPHHLLGPGLPVGGRGGNGGNVYAEPIKKLNERSDFSSIPSVVVGKNGSPGKGNRIRGNNGEDVLLRMPIGTQIYKFEPLGDLENWRNLCDNWSKNLIADFDSIECERVLLASGGLGGLGNNFSTPYESEFGTEPEENYYELQLKLIADVGLLGLPNVGKSTLFSTITRCVSKVGNYPFTTLSPYVGYVKFNDGVDLSIVDLPGIIDCGKENLFLSHLERVRLILYLIDPCNPTHNCIENFNTLRCFREKLIGYNLSEKPFIIVTSKMDIACKLSCKRTDELQQYVLTYVLTFYLAVLYRN
ncbi:GTP-binding protein, putative [Theileria annulata]|uniref:GTP-binding protein, putative n=1 Tax=Theileria annulata TaxID=5874 RepID=Q4UB00_THEAN|nr:GTP-binding protein, putative [Theileria annulata]CAI76001.1 GTP-binding protein, putative [Theileria annulata]|eukprot:XP_955477.1 GTP-binding protein, putative [Theileria annulata]